MRRVIIITAVVGFFFATAFSPSQQPASGQQQFPPTNRKPACTMFCGDGSPNYFSLFPREYASSGKCYGGPLPPDQASDQFNSLSEGDKATVCQNLKTASRRNTSCPAFKTLVALCNQNEPPKKECEKPTPWFGNSSACADAQAWVAEMDGRTVTLSICGAPVFRHVVEPPGEVNTYSSNLLSRVQKSAGTVVCCDKFREAARTGVPCDPRADVDCDGKPNQTDVLRELPPPKPNETDVLAPPSVLGPPYPSVSRLFTAPEGAAIDPFPPGLDANDIDFFPPQDKCDCKWELVKGTLTCSADGRQPHAYQARWRCPSSGNERFTRKEANATAPCTPPRR